MAYDSLGGKQNSLTIKVKINKMVFYQNHKFGLQKQCQKTETRGHKLEEIIHNTHLTKELYPKYIKNS